MSYFGVNVPPRRAFDERVDGHWGWYAGGAIGATLIGNHRGMQLELGYQRPATSARSTIEPHDTSLPTLVTDHRYRDHQILISFAGVFAF